MPTYDPALQAFFDHIGTEMTETQKTLFAKCATLSSDEAHAVLGGLLRIMLEPDQEFWAGLEDVFTALEPQWASLKVRTH
jgi:hypothetical protein